MIKIQWLESIWRQNDQNVELRRQTFKTKLNYKSDQNPMTCIDIWRQNDQNVELRRKTFKTKLNYKSDTNMFSYVAKHSKQRETTKVIKIQWLASIWRQNDQNVELRRQTFKTKLNYKSDQNPMTCIDIWRQNDQNVELRRKTFKTKLNYKSDQNPMTCIDLTSKRSNVELRRKTFKTKLNYKSDQNPMTCIDLTSKRSKCWVTSQNIQNKAKLQKWSKSNDLHRFDVKTIKMLRIRRKTFKTKLNYKSDQNPMTWFDIDYVAKHSKQRYKSDQMWLASIWRQNEKCWVTSQNIQNNAKLHNDLHRFDDQTTQNYESYRMKLHRFDDKTIKNVELRRKTFETTQSYKIDQITINCIDWMSKRSIMLSYVAKHSTQF